VNAWGLQVIIIIIIIIIMHGTMVMVLSSIIVTQVRYAYCHDIVLRMCGATGGSFDNE